MKYTVTIIMLLSVLVLLFGCAAPTSADVLTGTVTEAVRIPTETEQTPPAAEADTAPPTEQKLSETAESAENQPAETEPSVTDPASAEPASAEPVLTEPYRIAVPRMTSRPLYEAQSLLDAAGISYTVSEQYSNTQSKGNVITVRFHGILDEEFCHINPDYPVEVVVSLGYRQRTSVLAVDPKHIYLTFDDGPHKNTDRVLEILAEYGAKATFFTVGNYVSTYPDRVRAIVDGGHLLACHSNSHDYLSLYQSAEATLAEIHTWEKAVEAAEVALPETVYFRFPGGTTTTYMERDRYDEIFWAITDEGYLSMDWTCANNDKYLKGKTEDQTLQEYLIASAIATVKSIESSKSLPKIMLMHDTADETVEVLPQILEYLIGEGYTFATLDELDGYWVFH